MANSENILIGAAEVFTGPRGDQDLGLDAGVSARSTLREEGSNWRNVGLTQGGVEFSYAPDFGEVEVDQWLDVAKMFKQRQSVTVSTTFAEATLRNLLFAWGQKGGLDEALDETAGITGTLRISAGALGDKPQETGLVFVGQAPGGEDEDDAPTERVYHLYRALNVETSAFTLGRSEATTIPVSMRCLPSNAAGGLDADYGVIFDRTLT